MPKKERRIRSKFTGILDRFLKDPQYSETQERIGCNEAQCEEMDTIAQEDHN